MSISWYFLEARPGDRARETQVEKFFNSDAVANRANAIVREGIQNSLDAAPDGAAVHVRISVGRWSEVEKGERLGVYTQGFVDHFGAEDVLGKLKDPPKEGEEFRYLLFEDFGTSGLLGEPSQWWVDERGESNPFFNYFRAEGISDKIEGKRGRHGVGRLVFMFASRTQSIFGLTRRDDEKRLLMGTSVLRNHRVKHKPHLPDGWFGEASSEVAGLTLPIEDPDFLAQFAADFEVSRAPDESGLSVVVPWLSEDVTAAAITRAVLTGYFHPILRGELTVEVVDESHTSTAINAETIESVAQAHGAELAALIMPMITLAKASIILPTAELLTLAPPAQGAPKWSDACIPEEIRGQLRKKLDGGDLAAVRVPLRVRTKPEGITTETYFDVFLQLDSSENEGEITFIREGIIIAGVRPRRTSGVRAIVLVEEGPLATFLGDSENPSHTEWQKELVKDKYSFHLATIEYVIQSVPSILALLSDAQKKPDTALLMDLFSLPTDQDTDRKTKLPRRRKPGEEPDVVQPDLPATQRRFAISKIGGGFSIRRGGPDSERPPMLTVRVAYGVRRGSPFAKYDPADFRLGLGDIKCEFNGCELLDFAENWMLIRIDSDDFEVNVTGFDPNRDLHVDVKAKEQEAVDAAAS